MSKHPLGNLTVQQLAGRLWNEINNDNVWGASAELAYYFTLALFPMLLFLVNIVGYVSGLQDVIFTGLARVAPPEALKLIQDTLKDILKNRSGGLLSFSLIFTLWSASQGTSGLIDTLNVAYEFKETRPYWRVKLLSLGLTFALAILVMAGSWLIMFGDESADWLGSALGYGDVVRFIGILLHYALGLSLVLVGIGAIYSWAPNGPHRWNPFTPGAAFATFFITVISLGFSLYLRVVPGTSAVYGGLGAMIVLMTWLYLLSFVLLVGGEINSEIIKAQKG